VLVACDEVVLPKRRIEDVLWGEMLQVVVLSPVLGSGMVIRTPAGYACA
jgi:hypothetical protein